MSARVTCLVQQAEAAFRDHAWHRAEQLCRMALDSQSDHPGALNLLAVITAQTRRTAEAAELFRRSVEIQPGEAAAHNNYGNVLRGLGRLDEALDSFDRALALRPDYAEAYINRGNLLRDLKCADVALASYEQAIALRADIAQGYDGRGNALRDLGRHAEAVEAYSQALLLWPGWARCHLRRGNALLDLRRVKEALADYDAAIAIEPRVAQVHNNRGAALHELGRLEEALESYERAIELKPDYAEAHNNRGVTLREMKRLEAAAESLHEALRLKPDFPWVHGTWLHTLQQLCDWRDLDARIEAALLRIGRGEKVGLPFYALALADSPALQRRAAETWVHHMCPPKADRPTRSRGPVHERIRVGYFSADFHAHATAYLTAEMFELHDRRRFEVLAFSHGPDIHDAMRARLQAAFDQFHDVRTRTDQDVAQLARELGVDIAVDLGGFTHGERMGIFARRAAPLQVSYLGYPGTTAAPYMDYLIADRTLIPAGAPGRDYSEKICRLPNCYQMNDSKRSIASTEPARAELGLPPSAFVYCCFNNSYKIMPRVFDSWMRILRGVPASVLWLLLDNNTAAANLRREAALRGVDASRLIFAERTPLPAHLARQRAADLFLDTFPYNAHTTTSDALWAGLPVLTRIGSSFAARVAASLLGAIGLPELVTATDEQYEAQARELAHDRDRLAAIRQKLRANRASTPLFDSQSLTRHIEDAYEWMYRRHRSGAEPEDFDVPG